MKKIVVLPGGYHPYHAGHYSLYKAAEEKFPDADIYLAATNDTKTRPFPFEIKKKLAQLAGVNPDQFVQVKSPFKAEEITQKYNPEQDVLIFVRSEKDRTEQPKPGGTKKDGSPSYFQSYDPESLESFNKHAYIDYLPTIEFGPGIKSATEIRNAWPRLNDKQKLAMVMSLYPATQQNKKLATVAVKMLDAGILDDSLTEQEVEEATLINDPEQGHLIVPDGGMGTWDEKSLLSNLIRKFSSMAEMIKEKRYSSLYHSLYEAGVVENMLKALVQYENFKEKQGNRPIAKNKSIDLGENVIKEIGYASQLDTSKLSTERLLKIGKKVGTINGKEVWKAESGSDMVYFLVTDDVVHALLGFSNGYLRNVLNITKKSIPVRELLGYIVHVEKQKISVSSQEGLTEDGLKWIIYLLKRPSGLIITDQHGNSITPESLYKEWEQARDNDVDGSTGIIISERKEFGDKIRENERRRHTDSLILPFILYDNDDYLLEK